MMDSKEEMDEIFSLNSQLPKFFVEELEERLETDPLMIGGLLNVSGMEAESQAPCIGVQCDSGYSCWID